MLSSFKKIMSSPEYFCKRKKRFRIYMFAYHFGCVSLEDLSFIFSDNVEEFRNKPLKDIEHNNAQVLSYLSKNGFLEKLKDGYYLLKNKGLFELYDHLVNEKLIDDILFDEFNKKQARSFSHFSHSSKSGRTALLFLKSYGYDFISEPAFDANGNLIHNEMLSYQEKMFVPDILLYNHKIADEKIYIEADSSEGRLSTNILPKLHNYAEMIFGKSINDSSSTLHFAVWNNRVQNSCYCSSLYEREQLHELIQFISEVNPELNYAGCLSMIKSYSGGYSSVLNTSNFINSFGIEPVMDENSLFAQIDFMNLVNMFDSSFIIRQKSLFKFAIEKSFFVEKLYEGNRYVCLPVNANKLLLDFVYIEQSDKQRVLSFFSLFFNLKIDAYNYSKKHVFFDEIHNEYFCFRNVFKIKNNGLFKYIIFENISDEIGGKLRVQKYVHYPRNCSFDDDVIIVCLYNNFTHSNYKDNFSEKINASKNIHYISYKEFFFGCHNIKPVSSI